MTAQPPRPAHPICRPRKPPYNVDSWSFLTLISEILDLSGWSTDKGWPHPGSSLTSPVDSPSPKTPGPMVCNFGRVLGVHSEVSWGSQERGWNCSSPTVKPYRCRNRNTFHNKCRKNRKNLNISAPWHGIFKRIFANRSILGSRILSARFRRLICRI